MRVVAALGFLLVACAVDAHAAWSFGVSTELGARQLDDHLADYRWDAGPVPVFGLSGVAAHGRWSLQAGVVRSGTEQATGLPGIDTVPTVGLTSFGLRGGATLFHAGPFHADAGVGLHRMHLAWDPDRLDVDVDGTRVVVDFEAIDRWATSLDLGFAWDVTASAAIGLRARAERFSLETAHRRGDAIVEETETFVGYDATLFVRLMPWRTTSNAETLR